MAQLYIFNRFVTYFSKKEHKKCKAILLFHLGKMYIAHEKLEEATKYLQECEQIVLTENYSMLQLDLCKQMTKVALLKGETQKATSHFKKFEELNETLSDIYRKNINGSLDQVKQLIEKRQEINTLVLKEQYAIDQLRAQKIISISAIGLLFLSTLLAGLFYTYNIGLGRK